MAVAGQHSSLTVAAAEAQHRDHPLRVWGWFSLQIAFVASLQLAGEIIRGNFFPPSTAEAIRHARQVVDFEEAHDLFVEPLVQTWAHQSDYLGGLITWGHVVKFANGMYAVGHLVLPLLVAIWIFRYHRQHFALLRNVFVLTNVIALAGYELFPMAPPRLTSGLVFDDRVFHFRDTMQHIIGTGKLNGIPLGYNAFAAMPSVHIAWAIIVALTVVFVSRSLLLRILAALYPVLMVGTVVVTGNHYLLDAAGAALTVATAVILALAIERGHEHARLVIPRLSRSMKDGLGEV